MTERVVTLPEEQAKQVREWIDETDTLLRPLTIQVWGLELVFTRVDGDSFHGYINDTSGG